MAITINGDGTITGISAGGLPDNSVQTADIADDQITLAKMAGGTLTGEVIHNYTSSTQMPAGTTAQRPGSPTNGDFRYNSDDSSFEGYQGGSWGAVGGGATGPAGNAVFWENDQTVTDDYTITNNKNAGSFGPIAVATGKTVTVGAGEVWTVV